MRNYFKRFSVISGFALLLILLVGNGVLTRRDLGAQIATEQRLADARRVRLELETIESLLKDAESGQRGFLYTGDARYLAPYNHAKVEIDSHFKELMQLTFEDATQQSAIVALRALEQVKMTEMAQTIALYQDGKPDDARALVLSNYGLLTMEHFRQVMDGLEKQEDAQEDARALQYHQTVRRTIGSIYVASILATIGLVMLAYYILREMSLREEHAEEIREREEWFRTTLTSIGDAVIVADSAGRVTFLNPVAEALTCTRLIHARDRDISEVFPLVNEVTGAPTQNPVEQVIREGKVVGLANHSALRQPGGNLIPIEDSAAPIRDGSGRLIGVVLVFRDVTRERKSQELLRKTEKLAAAARLSATVAHEINNPLEAVGNLIYLCKVAPSASPEIVRHLRLAEDELARVAHITRQTLGFYRESNEPEPLDVPALVDSVLRLYSNKLQAKNIHVERQLGECPPMVGVAGELEQVISNLVSNAIDAVAPGGQVRIRLEHQDDAGGGAVQFVIEDDGPGIPAENLDRIFEPFFTTKKDVGTGLGLWVTREIVERHGGTICVHSGGATDAAPGASFVIQLPCRPAREVNPPLSLPVA
jgi:PAS domain S-box-containing protein